MPTNVLNYAPPVHNTGCPFAYSEQRHKWCNEASIHTHAYKRAELALEDCAKDVRLTAAAHERRQIPAGTSGKCRKFALNGRKIAYPPQPARRRGIDVGE